MDPICTDVIYCKDWCKEIIIDEGLCPHFEYVEPPIDHFLPPQEETSTEELLASLVQKSQPLLDHRLPIGERGKTIKDQLWLKVFKNMKGRFTSVQEMQKKWKNIRDTFVKVKLEMDCYIPSGSGIKKKKPTWKHYEIMKFSNDPIGCIITKTNLTMNSGEEVEKICHIPASETPPFTELRRRKRQDNNKKKQSLVPAAVPSCKLPELSHEMSRPRRNPPKTRANPTFSKQMASATTTKSNVEMDLPLNNPNFSNSETNECIQTAEALLNLQNLVVKQKFGVDCSTEVKSGDFIEPFSNRIVTSKDLSTLTGLQSFQLLYTIVELVEELFPKNRKKRTVMSLKDQVIFTFMKLKTGTRYNVLSILFQVNEVSCRIIFHETLIQLAKVLQYAITWPSKEQVLNSMPLCFEGFEKTRVILDCTEIPLQQAKCLCCRLKTYSQYKKRHTIKVLTGVSPAGLITYVSKAYGGRTSDKKLFEQSPVLQLYDQFVDNIMVDKGFLIGEIAEAEGIKIIQPPFLKKQNQFSRQDALLNAKIARARVHIERTNQRMKVFEILNKPLPLSLLSQVDNILTIVCAIVNLSNPIFSEDKFL